MAIGTATQIGQEIVYSVNVTNVTSIDSFNDSITGETMNRYFTKQFQIAIDGLFFTDLEDLTNINLAAFITDTLHSYTIKVTYTRNGSDATGDLILNSFSINSTQETIANSDVFNNSNFAKFFDWNDLDCINWSISVLNKLYFPGQVPKYLIRNSQ